VFSALSVLWGIGASDPPPLPCDTCPFQTKIKTDTCAHPCYLPSFSSMSSTTKNSPQNLAHISSPQHLYHRSTAGIIIVAFPLDSTTGRRCFPPGATPATDGSNVGRHREQRRPLSIATPAAVKSSAGCRQEQDHPQSRATTASVGSNSVPHWEQDQSPSRATQLPDGSNTSRHL
jgi:hypothetical protein